MNKNLPPPYSPLRALAKKALLWVVLPVGLLLVVAELLGGQSPNERAADRYLADLKAKADAAMADDRARIELQRQRAANHPDAKRLEAELSKLSPEQRAKRVSELMEEFAKKARAGQ